MAIDTKKYLDYAGLEVFWGKVKDYYDGTVTKANSALQGFWWRNSDDAEDDWHKIEPTTDKQIKLDLSGYALKKDVVKVLKFMGVVNYVKDLPTATKDTVGHIYHVKYAGESGTTPLNAEYVGVEEGAEGSKTYRWEEMGAIVDLSAYATWEDTKFYIDAAIDGAKLHADNVVETEKNRAEGIEAGLQTAISNEITDRTNAVATEKTAREAADTTLQGNIDAEAGAREAADNTEVVNRKAGDADVYGAILSIEDYKIKQLFIENKKSAATEAALVDAINNMGTNAEVVVKLTAPVTLTQKLQVEAGKTVIIDLNGQKLTAPSDKRAVNVTPGGYCAINNGTIEGSAYDYNIIVWGKKDEQTSGSTLILDGVTMTNSGTENLLLATSGNDKDVNLVFNNCNFEGMMYLPAQGSIIFNGGEFKANNAPVLYIKNGSPIEFNNVKMKSIFDANYDAKWAHWNNGCMDSPATLVIEACNYGPAGQGKNPSVKIVNGKFEAEKNGFTGEVFDILVINYEGNVPTQFECNVPYYETIKYVTGHVTDDTKKTPDDGWLNFTAEAGHGMASVVRVNG